MKAPVQKTQEPKVRKATKRSSNATRRKPKTPDVVEKMLANMEQQFTSKESKATVGDYIRLRQYRDERLTEEAKEIRVTWVEPNEKESATGT